MPSTVGVSSGAMRSPSANLELTVNTALQQGARLDGTGLVLPGVDGQFASTPNSAAVQVTGDIDIKTLVSFASWPQTNLANILSRFNVAANGGYTLIIFGQTIRLGWADTLSTTKGETATANPAVTANVPIWLRATLDVDNGAGEYEVKFYTSADGTTWTPLGTTITGTTGTTQITAGTANLAIGARANNFDRTITGTFQRAIIQNAYDTADNTSDVVFDSNFAAQPANVYSFTESSTNAATVTINSTHNIATLPLAGTVNCSVNWGDGQIEPFTTSGNKTHRYTNTGIYNIKVSGTLTGFGALIARPELVDATSFGRIGLTSLANGFRPSVNLTSAPSILPPAATVLQAVFFGCTNFNSPSVVGWSTGNITSMNSMFGSCTNFDQPIGGWQTGNVNTMLSMFSLATNFNQPIGGWDVSNVSGNGFAAMFFGSGYNHPLANWNVGKSTSFSQMFQNATAFDQPLGTWRPSKVTTMAFMFSGVTLSTANYDNLLEGWTDFTGSGWDTGSITAFADAGGGQVTVTTSAAHGYANNHVMRITGTTNYDGSYVISSVTATTFRITATFVATETGTWNATLQSGVTFSGGNSEYSVGAATTARGVLTSAPYSWTITDGGQA